MDSFAFVLLILVLVIAYNTRGWITAFWEGKAEVKKEDRLIAEASAREAEAKAKLASLNAGSSREIP